MLYDDLFKMIYDKSRIAVNFLNNCFVISGMAPFEMIYDCLFESVAVEVTKRQGILGELKKKTEEMTRKTNLRANGIAMP